jgi:CPA2 family monovalent cation:H+ antiporter-2
VIPWVLHGSPHTGSRELFRLAVLAIALGVAYGAALLFGVSFALGAFFAGMMLASRSFSQRRRGDPAAARRLRGAVLRLGRHAVRSPASW